MSGTPSHLYTGRDSDPPKTLCGAYKGMGDTWTVTESLVTCPGCLSRMSAAPERSEAVGEPSSPVTTHPERNHP